jgi:thiol-disulfide isomerase/thioredoxin
MHLRIPNGALPVLVPVLWFCLTTATTAATAADPPATSVLHLTNGGSVSGELRGSDDPKVLHWQSPLFARPFEFPLRAVTAVQYAVPGPQPKPLGEYCFELSGDDVLYGNLSGLTEDNVEVDSPRLGRLHLPRRQIRRFYRWKGAGAIYLGPNGLAGWKCTEPDARAREASRSLAGASGSSTPAWRDEGGQLSTDQPGASLFGDLGIPDKAVIEVELSWKRRPDFIFAFGVDERDLAGQHAFQLEVWDGELVAVGESARDADVASVQQIGPGEGRVRLQAYLDQEHGQLILLSPGGKRLAILNIGTKRRPIHSGVRLTNAKGDVSLELLRISRWNGPPPREAREDEPRLHQTDGSIVYGQVVAFDPESKKLILRDGMTETPVQEEAIAEAFGAKASTDTAADASSRTLRMVYRDGSRISGTPTRIEDTHLTLACPGVKEPLRLPLIDLRSLFVLPHGEAPAVPSVAGKPGRLEMDGINLRGRLVHGSEQPNASCLVWHPDLSLDGSPMLHGVSGRIVYRDPPPPRPSPPKVGRVIMRQNGNIVIQQIIQPNGRIVIQQFAVPPGNARAMLDGTSAQPPVSGRRSLHLRSGDTIPCEVLRMDDKGVTFKTPLSDGTFVAHEKIKSVELTATHYSSQIDEAKRNRLLTLPRLQKNSPPTHLIWSKNGDFLRGRVLEMDETRLKVEVRLETREIPRDRIAQIIWLHADELTGRKADTADASRANRVQAMRADGNRLTFAAQKADHKTISGTSDILGACRADLAEVDQLLFGTFIEESAAKLAYHLWKLHYATEPKFAQGDRDASADGALTGIESPLVGQPAYSFRLDLLDGPKFHLAEHRGRVVVLEFWATWCGPCLQTMPLVNGVVREFTGQGVELVAVNLEEQPEQVKAMLNRHKLKIPVALDRDGVVASKYAVTAIPQTVVIDRDGKIARLFVGGGKKTADALRKTLQELSAGKPTPAAVVIREPSVAPADAESSKYVKLVHALTGKVLAVADNSDEAGVQAVLAKDDGSEAQQWTFEKDGDHYKVVNRKSRMVLDVQGESMREGSAIIQWDDKAVGNDNQRWSWEGKGKARQLKCKSSALVLDVGEEGAVVQRKADERAKGQLWHVLEIKE